MHGKKILLFISIIFWAACSYLQGDKKIERDTSINERTSFNNIFFDSTAIDNFLNRETELKTYADQFQDFYLARNYTYAWFDSSGLAEQAHNFMNLLSNSIAQLNDSSLYDPTLFKDYERMLVDSGKSLTPAQKLQTELRFTGQFFQYAAKTYKGSDIDVAELGWFIPRKKIDLTALLDSSLRNKAVEPERFAPLNSQYKKLQQALQQFVQLQTNTDSTDTIPHVLQPIKKGMEDARIFAIKSRLIVYGDLAAHDSSNIYNDSCVNAVKRFQRRTGLAADGQIGNRLIEELNTPVATRIQQLLVNMERARWLPPESDSNYVVVNIPEYKLHVYDSGKLQYDMNVIVGSATNNTVIFNGNLKYIVFSPYWNVPSSIVQKEILPAMQRNPAYLDKNHMEITGGSKNSPSIRQKPGPWNSLGLVKFLFPNSYSIYFHDTPNRNLFSANNRSLSHGCIRLGEPKKFAEYLLRNDTTYWTSKRIDSCMNLPKEKWVTLSKPLPVFILYFTAWVDKNGVLNFRRDIYGHDRKMADKLFVKN